MGRHMRTFQNLDKEVRNSLRKCPFCGHPSHMVKIEKDFVVRYKPRCSNLNCDVMPALAESCKHKENAIDLWNTRTIVKC